MTTNKAGRYGANKLADCYTDRKLYHFRENNVIFSEDLLMITLLNFLSSGMEKWFCGFGVSPKMSSVKL